MAKRYRYLKKDGSWSETVEQKHLLLVAAGRLIKGHGKFQVQIDRETPSFARTRLETLDRLDQLSGSLDPNHRVRVTDGDDVLVFVYQRMSDFIETPGNDRVDRVHTFVFDKFGSDVYSLGICVCKQTVGSNVWSQHSWCNAEDYGAKGDKNMTAMQKLQAIARAVVSAQEPGGVLDGIVEHVIVGDRIWTKNYNSSKNPDDWWHDYTGEYHYHVHVDCDPNYTGVPPCAS